MTKQGISGSVPDRHSRWAIVCDFDGTISHVDVTDTLMEHFGHPDWKLLERRWETGEIGSRDCLSGQIALLDVSRPQLDACLDSISIDDEFGHFVRWAQASAIPLHVISDGLDYAIERILHNNHIVGLPVIANHLEQVSERRWRIRFPHYDPQCRQASGTCKCRAARTFGSRIVVAIGDGRSDFCVAAAADRVLAKRELLMECRRLGIAHLPFDNFGEAQACLEQLTASQRLATSEAL